MARKGALRVVPNEVQPIDGVPPPMDLDAEGVCLAACVFDPYGADIVLDRLDESMFFSDANKKIFKAIKTLVEDDGYRFGVDEGGMTAIAGWLRDRGWLDQVGGTAYVLEVCTKSVATTAGTLAKSCDRIADKAQRRLMLRTLQYFNAIGYHNEGVTDPRWVEHVLDAVGKVALIRKDTGSARLNKAMELAMGQVRREADSPDQMVGIPTGYVGIDEKTGGLRRRQVVLVGAPEKTGKSSLVRGISVHIARSRRVERVEKKDKTGSATIVEREVPRGVVIFSLEMDKEEVARELACTFGTVDGLRLQQKTATPDEYTRLFGAADWLASLPIEIVDARTCTLAEIRSHLRRITAQFINEGIELATVIVDTLQLLVRNEPKDEHEDDQTTHDRVARAVGHIAVDFDVPVLLVTQLNDNGQTRGSRAIQQHAQAKWVLKVRRDRVAQGWSEDDSRAPREAVLSVEFARNGGIGDVPLWFVPAYTQFRDA